MRLVQFLPLHSPHWLLQPEVMGTYIPLNGTLAGWSGVG